ncbi:OmpA family protein [Paraburkholderia sprentiae WSM5005]|uniref:OmpA family protein n=1 Tax=Paraburkholderia sprentiae WSM5005 TaxID=754502 RepID=A0A1I9YRU8_9BURK|nr:OmpA family protein [Paraburkholderia sprentiae]APA88923.2 OmpA family protein [Paraburkholderia sprentiae WSM5005]
MERKRFLRRGTRSLVALCFAVSAGNAIACTVSEDMTSSLLLNSTEIPNSERIKIADMMLAAKQWLNVEIRGIVYAGGYIKERSPKEIAAERAANLKSYLVQLGVKEKNVWVDTRIIKEPDVDDKENAALDQISVTLVPICDGGCARLCDDPRVTPTSKAIK